MRSQFRIAAVAAALCASFAVQSDARTLYVNASRPNNKGNGLSAKSAKKTIQAAINIAKKGDTILVYPGTYAQIGTTNKKITIKSVKGGAKTKISVKSYFSIDWPILSLGKGNLSKVAGFTVFPKKNSYGYGTAPAVNGGTIQSCTFVECGRGAYYDYKGVFSNTKLTACVLDGCYADTFGNFILKSTLNRCKIGDTQKEKKTPTIKSSTLCNTLVACNGPLAVASSELVNCTVADNSSFAMKSTKAFNTVFSKVPASQFKASKKNKLQNCYKGSSPKFVKTSSTKWAKGAGYEWLTVSGNVYWQVTDDDGVILEEGGPVLVAGSTDEEILAAAKAEVGRDDATYSIDSYEEEEGAYVTVPGDYRLAKGSPCINKGKLTKAQKKLVGSKDLAGKKRIKGKTIDIGCYEY